MAADKKKIIVLIGVLIIIVIAVGVCIGLVVENGDNCEVYLCYYG